MDWDLVDFAVFGSLLAGAALLLWLAARQSGIAAYRVAAGIAVAAAFLLIWVNGAVGIIGNEGNAANLMYVGVLAVLLVGAILARFRARGLALALAATAFAQSLVAVMALIAGHGSMGPAWPRDILFLTAFFTALWLVSALLFLNAARQSPTSGSH